MAEFKISRLRFSWVGEWADQKAYNKDEIVQYNGKAYVCLIPHTSNGFYQDLQDVNPKWELMMTGQTWKGVWEQFTFYSLDNIVIFGGIVYKCNTEHLSGAVLDTDITKWDVYAESKTWQSEWTSNTLYGPGDIVQYGGSTYECIISHTSAATDLEGLELDYNDQLDSTQVKWKLTKEGFQWRGEYATSSEDSSTLRYKINDIVKYGPSVYKCIEGHSPAVDLNDYSTQTPLHETFDETKWELWVPGLAFDNVWNEDAIYQPGDIVLYGGYLYQSKVINNINIIPSFNAGDSSDAWELISTAYDLEGPWDSATSYKVGSVVTYGGDLYVAIADSTNVIPGNTQIQVGYEADGSSGTTLKVDTVDSVDPKSITPGMTVIGEGFARGQSVQSVTTDTETGVSTIILTEAPDGVITDGTILTFAGTSYPYWELMIPGFSWKGKWADSVTYHQDDVVYWKNATYVSIVEHTSALVNRPDNDLVNNYWALYLQHDQRNSLSDVGEMVVFENGATTALAIGGQSQVLKVVNSLPVWSDVDFTPNVYYVATNGVDAPERGTTPDTAWKTIAYACEQVAQGTGKQNEKALLDANKEWVIEEMFYWFLYQQNQNIAPFDQSINFDNEKTKRDARYIFDGVVTDLARGQNARTVNNALAYFDLESTNKYTNDTVAAQAEQFSATVGQLFNLIEAALTNTAPAQSYQDLEFASPKVPQYFNSSLTIEPDTITVLGSLERIIREALDAGTPKSIPPANQGGYSTINVKSGTYEENLPIVLPARCALNGDELRGAAVKPARAVNTLCTRTFGDINQFIVGSTVNMEHNTPVQFVSLNPVDQISTIIGGSNIIQGVTYYVIGDSITDTSFSVAYEPDGEEVPLFTNIGYMYVYGGDALGDMFRVQNDTGIRNMTLTGLLGTLTPQNQYETRRPSGGSFVSFDPGDGPDDTRGWITRKSPYVQNVTNFGKGCTGMKIDSTLHNGGNRSMVANDFTQIISDGIGVWCTGGDALVELVSVFTYYNYAGYMAEDGGKIRATNGNSSYGKFGVIAEGYDDNEIPATGNVNNRDNQATASAVSALGANAEILKIEFEHAGESYFTPTTNMICHSNYFLDSTVWTTDGNLNITKAASTPFVGQTAWKIEGITNLTDSSYIYQDLVVSPQGRTYSNIAGENITGSGIEATFDITVTSDAYTISVNNGGSGYVVGNQIKILGSVFGGIDGVNDIIITVDTLSITAILTVSHTGTVPAGSALPYTASIYAKKGTSAYFDMYLVWSGLQTRTSYVRFNFDTELVTTSQIDDGGLVPATYQAEYVENDWWRISFTAWDIDARNDALQFRVYPRGIDGIAGYTNFYGAQVQIGDAPTFLLNTNANIPTSYANINVAGAGTGAYAIADELRAEGVFQVRLLEDEAYTAGGKGYKLQSNNAQSGNDEYLTLAQSEVATPAEYEGMRLSISSGKGAGQYGRISRYNEGTKRAYVLKESFDTLEITNTDATSDRFRLNDNADFHTVYPGQKIQFTPTYYDVNVTSTAQSQVQVLGTLGDLNNFMYVSSTAQLRVGQKINFTGTTFGGVVEGFDYYIINVIDERSIQISTTLNGGVWPMNNVNIEDPQGAPIVLTTDEAPFNLNYPSNTSYLYATDTSDMRVTYPIQFTGVSLGEIELGTTYYIHEIYNGNQFSISANTTDIEATNTDVSGNITIADTSVLIPLNPVIFKSGVFGNIVEDTQYWIKNIVDGTDFTITDSIVSTTATETQATTNLITVTSTAGFSVGSPIIFTGTTFGGINNDQVYYIQVVNDATTFTISETPSGSAVALTSATGNIITRTAGSTVSLNTATGTMAGVSPGEKEVVESAGGQTMESSFYTETYGGIAAGTTYYVLEKFEDIPVDTYTQAGNWINTNNMTAWSDQQLQFEFDATPDAALLTYLTNLSEGDIVYITDSVYGNLEAIIGPGGWLPSAPAGGLMVSIATSNSSPFSAGLGGNPYDGAFTSVAFATGAATPKEFTIATTAGGVTPVALITDSGSMQIGEVGWDHINPGTLPVTTFDSTSRYTVEPRLEFSAPAFVQTDMGSTLTNEYNVIGSNGFYPIAFPRLGREAITTSDFASWDTTIELPQGGDDVATGPLGANPDYNGGWIDVAYGNNTWVLISPSGKILYSASEGVSWLSGLMPALNANEEYVAIAYGNGAFIAIGRGSAYNAISTDNGATWTQVTQTIGDDDWVDIAYGNETFVAISGSSHTIKYTTDNGTTWLESTLDTSVDSTINNWSQIEYGNGRFVAVSSDERPAAYSFDGITWYASNLLVKGEILKYGNGVFVLMNVADGICCQSPDGVHWKVLNGAVSPYTALGFAFDKTNEKGWFLTMSSDNTASKITTGTKPLARANVNDGLITSVGIITPGSGYSTPPTLRVIDPNNSEDASFQVRVGDGVLGDPTFINNGLGYNTTSTAITIKGSGYSDAYQTGLKLICKNLTRVPQPGDNLQFNGTGEVYRVAKATTLRGTSIPNLETEIQLSPSLTQADTPDHDTPITLRSRFSQVRLTNHDFLNVGFGNEFESNFPGLPEENRLEPQDEVQETNNGRVFYSSTDQDGNFRVGDLFAVEQATGIVTLSADEFGLDGLTELSIGGVALGGSPVVVKAFSTDGTFTANSNQLVPTQKAIKTYLTSRLSQGGSDTFTGLLTAGTVKVGGPDEITSTVQEGAEGWQIKIGAKMNQSGVFGNSGWAGDGLALSYFMRTFVDPTRDGQQ